ncbi:MAG TPA: GH116 family glycosyl hydrolase [Thermoguttaceae bacterium]|nr:GH116 family glycosyl hydrolase [Thermoguttaceae bacterium]
MTDARRPHRQNLGPHSDGQAATSEPCCGGPIGRREFIKLAGIASASLSAARAGSEAIAGPFESNDTADHFVPADKKLKPEWVAALFAKGERTWYRGRDLETIAMPVGGICAGQLYLVGDGRLMNWDVFNQPIFTGYGRDNYQLGRTPPSPLEQGFAIQVHAAGKTISRTLDCEGFPGVRFSGEYPIGTVEYRDDAVPVSVTLEAFSPFVPLNAPDSALPATVMQFTVTNASDSEADVTLAGWLENGVCCASGDGFYGLRQNRVVQSDGVTMVFGSAKPVEPPRVEREPIVLAEFEGDDYGDWAVEGEAFGKGPAHGTLPSQQEVSGFQGKGLVNTFLGGDRPHGKLTSPPFEIDRAFVNFRLGGGTHEGKTCINLVVDGKVARTAAGRNSEKLEWNHWNVRDLAGKQARIEIVDRESGGWGHVNVDSIELADKPRAKFQGPLEDQADFGTMGLALLGDPAGVVASASLPEGSPSEVVFAEGGPAESGGPEKPFGETLCGALGRKLRLGPGEAAQVTFVVAWCFPNRSQQGEKRGNFYATRFQDAAAVARYVAENFDRLAGQTRLWHDTWYDSTLPHWLLDRLLSTTSTLATSTCQWWANGRFWAWEGVGCCHGTCAHVWNYEHAMARLFPELERSVREMQDYHPDAGFDEETGMVRFRGEGWKMWAGDGQAGTVLKAYREHQVSPDDAFLKRNWPRIKRSLQFLIGEDGNADGLLEGSQHNTYDINFHGPNTMVGSLYLAALRAGEEMAREMADAPFADECRRIYESGHRRSVETLFNGEYFVQKVDLEKHPKHQYGDGCLSDQLFGQGWAHQVGLGYVYPQENVAATLASIWRYNWAPDVGPQNEAHQPERWFASPGEAGLFTCTWPKSTYLIEGVRYKNEVWTGIEYQVAGNMAWDGMLTEALAICRAVHERYHPAKHNPWNEVECGDHYARGMAGYGVFVGLCGFECHGPKGHLGFAPRITPDDFRAAFTAAEGWGTISQKREGKTQSNRIEVKWGQLRLKTLALELPEDALLAKASVLVAGRRVQADAKQEGRRVTLTLPKPVVLREGEAIEVEVTV